MATSSIRSIPAILVAALLFQPSASWAEAVEQPGYDCFDFTQTTGLGQAYSGTCIIESPFAGPLRGGLFEYFHFEDWESFNLNTFVNPLPVTVPGVTVMSGGVTTGGFSPDSDDGLVDNISNGTVPLQTAFALGGSPKAAIDFDAVALGSLPTHAGLVVTGVGSNNVDIAVTAEFFGPGGVSLGTVVSNFNQTSASDSTDDAFMGWTDEGGIESISVDSSAPGINFDHLQYGREATLPPTVPMLTSAPLGVLLVVLVLLASVALPRYGKSQG
jgi:hypothetical protein